MMYQQIFRTDGREVIPIEIPDALGEPRHEGFEQEVGAFRYDQLPQVTDAQEATGLEYVLLLDVQLLDDRVLHLLRHER